MLNFKKRIGIDIYYSKIPHTSGCSFPQHPIMNSVLET